MKQFIFIGALFFCSQTIFSSLSAQNYKYYYTNGNKLMDSKNHELAIKYFDTAIAKNSKKVNAYFNRGLCYAELNDHFRAENDFSYYIIKYPSDASAYHERAVSRDQILDTMGAKEDFDKSVALAPLKRKYRADRAFFYTFELDEHETSISDMNVILSQDSTDSKSLFMKGYNYFMLEQYDSTIKTLNLSLKYDTANEYAHYYIGRAYYNNDEYAKAIISYNNAIQIVATDFRFYQARGLAYIFNDDDEDDYLACQDFQTAIKLGSTTAQKYLDEYCGEDNG